MRIRVIADLHLRNISTPANKAQVDNVVRLINLDPTPDYVVMAGDIFHNFGRVDAEEIRMLREIVDRSPATCVFIDGNHDILEADGKSAVRGVFPFGSAIRLDDYGRVDLVDNTKNWMATIRKRASEPLLRSVLISHGPVKEAMPSHWPGSEHALSIEEFHPALKLVVLGDIHRHWMGVNRHGTQVIYTGPPYATNRAELSNPDFGAVDILFDGWEYKGWERVTYEPEQFITARTSVPVEAKVSAVMSTSFSGLLAKHVGQLGLTQSEQDLLTKLSANDNWSAPSEAEVRFVSVKLANFLSYAEADLSLGDGLIAASARNLDDPTAHNNGSGKSALFHAISWALYGKTLRGTGANEVVRNGCDECSVSLHFTVGDQHFTVERSRKHGKPKLKIYHDTASVEHATVAIAQQMVERLIGMSFDQFKAACVVGTSFGSLTPKEQYDILTALTGGSRVKAWAAALEAETKERSALATKEAANYQAACAATGALASSITGLKERLAKRVAAAPPEGDEAVLYAQMNEAQAAYRKAQEQVKRTAQELSSVPTSFDTDTSFKPCARCGRTVSVMPPIEGEIAAAKAKATYLSALLTADLSIADTAEKRWNRANEALNQYRKQVAAHKAATEDLEGVIVETEGRLHVAELAEKAAFARSEAATAALQCCNTLRGKLFGPKGLESMLFSEAGDAINSAIESNLALLSEGNMSARIEWNGAAFSFVASCAYGGKSYDVLSDGQRQKVNVATSLALMQVFKSNVGLALADEYDRHMDDVAAARAVELLSELKGTVLVASHKSAVRPFAQRVVEVTFKGGVSTAKEIVG